MTAVTIQWVDVGLPWRVHTTPELDAARERVAREYDAALTRFAACHPFSAGCLNRGDHLGYARVGELEDRHPWLRTDGMTNDAYARRMIREMFSVCGTPDFTDAYALGWRRAAYLMQLEYLEGPDGEALRAAEAAEREAHARKRNAQFCTHPLCAPGALLEVRQTSGDVVRLLIGSTGPGGNLDGLVADDDVVLRAADLGGMLNKED